jgi:DUF2934 family protein
MPKSTKPQSTTATRTIRSKKPQTVLDTTPQPVFTHDDIATRAYELFLGEGSPQGRELEHWLRAEHELRERVSLSSR